MRRERAVLTGIQERRLTWGNTVQSPTDEGRVRTRKDARVDSDQQSTKREKNQRSGNAYSSCEGQFKPYARADII